MAKMMGRVRPGHRGKCRYAARGCTCYFYAGQHGRDAARLRRRAQRHAERAELARTMR